MDTITALDIFIVKQTTTALKILGTQLFLVHDQITCIYIPTETERLCCSLFVLSTCNACKLHE